MLVPVLLFIVGLLFLIKGGDWFVDGASALARRFHLPELLIGATVVSIAQRCRRSWFPRCRRFPATARLPTAMPLARHLQLGADRSHHDCRAPWARLTPRR